MSEDVRGRKVAPIYNALDSGNYKGAIKLCQKKDIEKWDITQALLSYALVCMHRNEEALEVARAVKNKKPTDENTLSAITLTFKTARAEEDAAECFENALAAHPHREDYQQDLICCYLRLGDYKRMQLTAQKMYKSTMKPKYMFWVVTSMLLQQALPPAMLDVAERMLTKILSEQTDAPGADEIMLMGELYRRQLLLLPPKSDAADEKLTAAFRYMDGLIAMPASHPIDDDAFYAAENGAMIKSYSSNVLFMKLDLVLEFASETCSLTNAVIADILSVYPDHWEALKALVDKCFGPNAADLSSSETVSGAMAACRAQLLAFQTENPKLRGPYLAEIYLLRVQTEKQNTTSLLSEIVSLIVAYMDRFDSKQCCFTDVKPLLRYLALTLPPSAEKQSMLQELVEKVDARCSRLSSEVKQCSTENKEALTIGLYKVCNAFDVKFFLDAVWREESDVQLLQPTQAHMLELYASTKSTKDGIGGDREVYPGDELLWLVAKYMQQCITAGQCNEEKTMSSVTVWAAVLLQGKQASPYNYVFATELLEPLRRLACSQFTLDMFNALEVKNVQVDSLSYLLIPAMFETCCFPEIRQQYRVIMRFHDTGLRDTREMMSRSIKNANYAKSIELEEFARVCERSTQLAVAKSALLVDALCPDYPIVGVSRGFETLTGFTREDMLGNNCRCILHGVPEVAISKSVRKNLRDFCRMSRMQGLDLISEVVSVQPNARRDGSQFMNFFMIGRLTVKRHPYLLGVQVPIGEGLFVKLNGTLLEQTFETTLTVFKRTRQALLSSFPEEVPQAWAAAMPGELGAPSFTFFTERLQDHCLILNRGRTVMRREPQELSTNCLVFGGQPVKHTPEGLFFAVLVDDVVPTFEGMPLIGFTKRKPVDASTLYPKVSRCLGASVLVGACGEAFARDQDSHFKIGFRPPPPDEVQSWHLDPDLPPHKRRPPVDVQSGDVLGCMYTAGGRIQLWHNGTVVLDFDVGRPVEKDADYYAVVDVCLSTYCVTVLPWLSPQDGRHHVQALEVPRALASSRSSPPALLSPALASAGSPAHEGIDAMVSDVVNGALVKKAIRAVVGECQFCVTIADPKGNDIPLVAVSEAFESMTGYKRSEILGVNCRFLNQGCPISPMDLMGLRLASESGSTFTALLPNRKKSGEMFINLLDLRGLTIARHLETDEELWYLIGIQADVTGLTESAIPEDHLAELQELARMIRGKLKKELSQLVVDGAVDRQLTSSSCSSGRRVDSPSLAWKLLQEPVWTSPHFSQQAVADIARRDKVRRRQREDDQLPVLGIGRSLATLGRMHFCMLGMSVIAFFAGLMFGRGPRRRT